MEYRPENIVTEFKLFLGQNGRHTATVESYARDSQSFLEFIRQEGVHDGDVSAATLTEFQEHLLARGQAENSIRRAVIGVRQLYRFIQGKNGWENSPLDLTVIPKRNDHSDFRLKGPQFDQLILDLQSGAHHILKVARDRSMLLLLGREGLKVNELIHLKWKDFFDLDSQARLAVGGPKARKISVESETSDSLTQLRQIVEKAVGPDCVKSSKSVLMGFKGVEAKTAHQNLTRHGVKFALYELGDRIGISHLNSEDLRHHAIAHKLSLGWTSEMVMAHLGLKTLGKLRTHTAD